MVIFSPSVNAETYLITGKATYADNSPVPLEYVTVGCENGNYDCYQHRGNKVMTNAYGDFTLMLDVDNEDNSEICKIFKIESMPSFCLVKNRECINTFKGADINGIKNMLNI